MKTGLLIGHPQAGRRSAILYTILQNCKIHNIDLRAYLIDVFNRLPNTKTGHQSIRTLQSKVLENTN